MRRGTIPAIPRCGSFFPAGRRVARPLAAGLMAVALMTGCAGIENSAAEDSAPAPAAEVRCVVDPPPDAAHRACTQQYQPVCGCNGRTYSNSCYAALAGVSDWEPGACEGEGKLR